MKVIRAQHLGMCFGVRDAIQLAAQTAASQPLTILGELVHNPTVVEQLQQQGVQIETSPQALATPTVMITAHGASQKTLAELRARRFHVLEATCPLVRVAHQAAMKLSQEGYFPVLIGKPGHVEVRGLTGDLPGHAIVHSEDDIDRVPTRPRYGVFAQTTQPVEKVRRLTELLRRRFPNSEVRLVDTVCQPTKLRQSAAIELAQQCDAIVVVGGAQSNNTRELAATCRRFCEHVFHVETSGQLRAEWFQNFETIGLTAGTSTPDEIIDQVEQWLCELDLEKAPGAAARAFQPAEAGDFPIVCLREGANR